MKNFLLPIVLALVACSTPHSPPTLVTATTAQNSNATLRFEIGGMACQACANRLEAGIRKLDGVTAAQVVFATRLLTVQFTPSKIDAGRIKAEIERLGFEAKVAPAGTDGGTVL